MYREAFSKKRRLFRRVCYNPYHMKFMADLHVHSRYSRATSREMSPEGLWRWAQLKGISVIGTGDFTHPGWFEELKEKLEPTARGLFALREKYRIGDVPETCQSDVHFMFQAEISSIYSKNGRTRKVHSIVLAPGFKEAEGINRRLSAIGNLVSDGRPILGLDAKELLRIVLDVSPECMVVPAHAWTPHFSVFGAASGFDSLEECYEDLTPHIYAIETGLSSDPPMNRRLSALDNITLISNSDAHSPSKLGRESNVFDTEISYPHIIDAIRTQQGFWGTVEFFPEEGKYHLDGHRNCGVIMAPKETKKQGYLCPVCGRKLTVGVMHRVDELADRDAPKKERFKSIIPLAEMLAAIMQRGVNTKGVQKRYFELLNALGSEFKILIDLPLKDIEKAGGVEIRNAISSMRKGEVDIDPGYDGVFGRISVTGKNRPRAKKACPPAKKRVKRAGQGNLF
jgi:uncharacterized protein (TIGR00375 family)